MANDLWAHQAEELATKLGAEVKEIRGARDSAQWEIIWKGVSSTAHEPEAVFMYLTGIQVGINKS